jgi:agmatine deiminase
MSVGRGGVEVNGQGTLLATRSSIVNPNRNPGKTLDEIERVLREYLCIEHFIWLSGAPGIGDTDFRIDGAARFVDAQTVLYGWTDDTGHPCDAALEEFKRLSEKHHPEPLPKEVLAELGRILAAAEREAERIG